MRNDKKTHMKMVNKNFQERINKENIFMEKEKKGAIEFPDIHPNLSRILK
jgi:hypothetical protein